jgi:K+-transporting ATPase KdpF subunit
MIKFFMNTFMQAIAYIFPRWRKQNLLLAIAVIFGLHLLFHPVVYAVTRITVNQTSAWAFRVLAIILVALVIYLFTVIFQPERF